MFIWTALIRSTLLRLFVLFFVLTNGSLGIAKDEVPADNGAGNDLEDVTKLAPYKVKGTRMEDFGFRFRGMLAIPGPSYLMVTGVLPNTPAAKAGLRPGELISKMEGKSLSIFSMPKLLKMPQRKWEELEAGKKIVTWSMEVRTPGAADSRTVTLVIPSPAPHWGSKTWSAPEGRMPAVVNEEGPLAALTREVLDNGIWSMPQDVLSPGAPSFFKDPILGYEWSIGQKSGMHRIWVTQQRGKTEIILEHRLPETGSRLFLTSPSGAMEEAKCQAPRRMDKGNEIPPEEIRAQFEAEIDFWLTKVGRVTGRWPFEALSGETEVIANSSNANSETAEVSAPLAESFLKLPMATAAQKELFFTAFGKVGTDGNCWAYTETSRSIGDDHETTVRFDPSKPPEGRSTLLKVDGKVPKPAYLQQWRNEEHGALSGLGELPSLSSVVDMNDVRVYSDETAAIVFELPVKASNSDFPADKFQARFRVNKTYRGFEDLSVKLRESMRVAGIAKVTDAGLEARFQTFDPALAPQPVLLKMGGAVRVLFVKVSRAFEATRTDFKQVVPFDNEVKPAP
jgi:hypothetical protein